MRELFSYSLDPELIYLNSGSHSISPDFLLEAITHHQREYERNPTLNLFNAWGRLWKTQARVAKFFGANPEDFFFRVNVTEAMNAFVLGMPLPPGEILVSDLEYGAITNLARVRAERDGRALRFLHLPNSPSELARLTAESAAEQVISQLRPDTRMLILSDVMTSNGLALPLPEIARETRKRGILLAIDGAHGPGFLPVDLSRCDDLDFYGGNLHKWMLGPKGTGFGWVPKRHHAAMRPLQGGWTSFETPAVFQAFGGGNRFAAAMLMPGCRDFAPFFALEELLDFWEKTGPAQIAARVRDRQVRLESCLVRKLGWPVASPSVESGLRGPLLAFEVPARLHGRMAELPAQLIMKHKLQVVLLNVQDRWLLRVSPHVYNTDEEFDRAAEILAAL